MAVVGRITTGRQIVLRDGRRLGFAEFGDPTGKPVFLFHSLPGSRLFRHPDDAVTAALRVRLITMDRPGFGLSDFQPGRRLLHWPDDVTTLANALGIERFAVIGVGAGAPYAAACAYKIPRRVTTTAIISGISPMNRRGMKENMVPMLRNFYIMAYRAPYLLRLVMWFGAREAQNYPEKYLSRMDGAALLETDRQKFLHDPVYRAVWVESITEAFVRGSTPFSEDMIIISRPWRFSLQDIRIPVYLWHGEADAFAPMQMGQYMAQMIPACEAHFYPNEGHAIMFTHWSEILSALTAEFERLHD